MSAIKQVDLARKLGLSRPAVSYALSGNPRLQRKLGPETRRRIMDAAREMGYRPHRHAQIMRKGKSGAIGLLQFGGFVQVNELRGVHAARAVREHGFSPLIHHVLWYHENVQDALNALLEARVEGLVLVSPSEYIPSSFLDQIRGAGIAAISLSGVHFPGVPQVRSDVRQGMFDLTNHLLGLGYRKLALLSKWGTRFHDEEHGWPLLERVAGFQGAASQSLSGSVEVEVICDGSEEPPSGSLQTGKSAMKKLLQRPRRPEAVLCTNDSWAVGALAACAEAGLRVPEDIAVTGFDNDEIGEFSVPPLTTIAQPAEAMAKRAVEMLVRMIRGETFSAGEELVKMPCQLVVRRSCGASLPGKGAQKTRSK